MVNRLPDLEDRISETLVTMNAALGSIDRFATGLQNENGSFDRLLVQLRSTAANLGAQIERGEARRNDLVDPHRRRERLHGRDRIR